MGRSQLPKVTVDHHGVGVTALNDAKIVNVVPTLGLGPILKFLSMDMAGPQWSKVKLFVAHFLH